jgi:hypothetical protein
MAALVAVLHQTMEIHSALVIHQQQCHHKEMMAVFSQQVISQAVIAQAAVVGHPNLVDLQPRLTPHMALEAMARHPQLRAHLQPVLAAVAGVHSIQLLGLLVQAAAELVVTVLLTQLLAQQTRAVVVAGAGI